MATAVARGPPLSPTPLSPAISTPSSKPRAKKKVRMQEVVPDEELDKPVDAFHVQISDVQADLRIAEPRPVLLTFEFDNYWYAETTVYAHDVRPKWKFNAASMRGHDGRRPVSPTPSQAAPVHGIVPAASFVYETEFGYKLHRKFLVVKLSERSPYGDVEWGTGVLPLDSIARGCPRAEISIVAKDNVTCYGNVTCTINMVNVQKVRAHVTDMKLSDYPEAYNYDVKLIYLEFGLKGFEKGYEKCTEKRSDGEPRFSAQPALEYHASLRDMLVSSSSGSPSLKIFFSVHRQVARTRTEEIGVGALPVRLLFKKVTEGWMDLPTKFKVPLADYKGVIRGKILLRNIPQFSQLNGGDLVNVNGNVLPQTVDLASRKLLPWVKLPRSMDSKSRLSVSTSTLDVAQQPSSEQVMTSDSAPQQVSRVSESGANHSPFTQSTHYPSAPTESVYEGHDTSHGNRYLKSSAKTCPATHEDSSVSTQHAGSLAKAQEARRTSISPLAVRDEIYTNEPQNSYMSAAEIIRAKLEGRAVPAKRRSEEESGQDEARPRSEWMGGMTKDEELARESNTPRRAEYGTQAHAHEIETAGYVQFGNNENNVQESRYERARDVSGSHGSPFPERRTATVTEHYREMTTWEESRVEEHDASPRLRERRDKSQKSFGSLGGTTDGGVEIGSVVLSTGSDEGYATGSRTTTEDVLTASHRLGAGPPSDEHYAVDDEETEVEDFDRKTVSTSGTFIGYSAEGLEDTEDQEWMAILDPSSSRYYFAHRYTQESLWLPPEWERVLDDNGRQYFVDHGSMSTQREFPAKEAIAYRESVYTGR